MTRGFRPQHRGEILGILTEPPLFWKRLVAEVGIEWAMFLYGPMEREGRDELLMLGGHR